MNNRESSNMYDVVILPSYNDKDFDENIDYKDKLYYHNFMNSALAGTHDLIREVKVVSLQIDKIRNGSHRAYPNMQTYFEVFDILSDPQFSPADSIENLRKSIIRSVDHAVDYEKRLSKIPFNYRFSVKQLPMPDEHEVLTEFLLKESHSKQKKKSPHRIMLPVIEFNEYMVGINELGKNVQLDKRWIEDTIGLLQMFTERMLIFNDRLTANDFLFNENGKLTAFIGCGKLTESSLPSMRILEENIFQLKMLLDHMMESGREIFQGNLIKIYNKINNKGNDTSSGVSYDSFEEIRKDLRGEAISKHDRKKIAVYLDYANLFTSFSVLNPDLRLLFSTLFGKYNASRINRKEAVLFKPNYDLASRIERQSKYLRRATAYLNKYGFNVHIVENNMRHAKIIANGSEYDSDDQMLIEIIRDSYHQFDTIVIMSGDGHFFDIADHISSSDREVIFVSKKRESTSTRIMNNFQTHLLEDYVECYITE